MATPGGGSDESSPQQQTSCQAYDQLQPVPSASRRERLRGGYECEIVRPPEKIQTECSICLQVLKEPQLISCCGHNFCRTCIERVKKDGKNCPLCNEAEFTLMHNKGLERSMKEFEVFCTHRKSGCKWVGELRMLEQHLNANPEAEKQLEGCEFVELECMYECEHCFQRHVLDNHQINECPKRPYSCDYCREYESTFEDVVNSHYPVCKCYPLACPNACTPYAIERQNLQCHLDNDCPLQVVDCDFHYTGCNVKLPRKDMPAHLAENFTHMTLLATFNQKLIQKNDEMKQLTEDLRREVVASQTAIDGLKQENEALKEEILEIRTKEFVSKETLEEEVAHLKQDITTSEAQYQFLKTEVDQLKEDTVPRAQHVALQASVEKIHHHVCIVPVQLTMASFLKLKRDGDDWHSDPFYTHPHGYKVCLNVIANGYGDGEGTHVSVSICLMCGEFDNHLKWPFRGDITTQLLNQLEDKEHHTKTIPFTDETPDAIAGRVTTGKRGEGWGYHQFIGHGELNYNFAKKCQYLKNNCLHFRVAKVELTN